MAEVGMGTVKILVTNVNTDFYNSEGCFNEMRRNIMI